MSLQSHRFTGMPALWAVLVGQFISLMGTTMTQFGLKIWAYTETGSATIIATLAVVNFVPGLLLSPIIGVLVDRYDRRLMMMVSDLAAGMVSIIIFILYSTGQLAIWHLYVSAVITGIFGSFQYPAYAAAIALMIPKEHYVRANSLLDVVDPGARILSPVLAGAIFGLGAAAGWDGLRIIMLIDIVTFSAAIVSLFLIHVPPTPPAEISDIAEAEKTFFREVLYGFRYVLERPPLVALQSIFLFGNFLGTIGSILITPVVLARTGSNPLVYGISQVVMSAGAVAGGVVVGAWGGFKRRVHGVLIGWALFYLLAYILFGLGGPQSPFRLGLWAAGLFLGWAIPSLIDASNSAIWMAKVDPAVQGRVFTARSFIAGLAMPAAGLLGGPLADFVMEPAMRPGGALVGLLGPLVGTGPGAGMSAIQLIIGVVGFTLSLCLWFIPIVRNVEDLLPDHKATSAG